MNHTDHYPPRGQQQQHSRLVPRDPKLLQKYLDDLHEDPQLSASEWLGGKGICKDELPGMALQYQRAGQARMQAVNQ